MLHHQKTVSPVRPTAVAGTWYPGTREALETAIDGHMAAAEEGQPALRRVIALIAPHAGLMYSGAVAAHAYRQVRNQAIDLVVLAGPSHFVGFEGVAVYRRGGFDSPLGVAAVDEQCANAMIRASRTIQEHDGAHAREHSLEMQLPFVRRLLPDAKVLPLVMGRQTPGTATALGDALASVLEGKRALMVASTDLSHYKDATTAARLDGIVIEHVRRFDSDGLQRALTANPEHACGGGPAVAVMRAAQALGARDAVVLKYADSGDVSGDKTAVVGYLAAAFGIGDHADDQRG